MSLKQPHDATSLKTLLGIMGYYRSYVANYSAISRPLTMLTRKGVIWGPETWKPEHEAALDELKAELCTEGKALKRFNPAAATYLYTDFSNAGIGAVLSQQDSEGVEYMVAAISRSLNLHEANYSAYEGEMLAPVWACKTLRCYLHGIQFTLVSDHLPLS